LTSQEKKLALRNSLRYFDKEHHAELAVEFLHELNTFGRIIMNRFRPTEYDMKAHPIEAYPAQCQEAAAIMLMIQNNLDPAVAQFPHELITYGGNGSVFQNWAQYRLVMQYLSKMTREQTLVMYSGHPLGLFPSSPSAPRVVVTNGMVIPNHSTPDEYEKMNAMGVSQYGQMTAGSYMYIGPQGIVHGTTITLLNAARMHLGLSASEGLGGVTFITSGLGGMSGAQAKAATIAGAACIVAETNEHAARKRHTQGWLTDVTDNIDEAIDLMVSAASKKKPISVGLIGNIVELWERCIERNISIDLGSDQTSLHNPFQGGYFPADFSYEESAIMLSERPEQFVNEVQKTLRRHANAINTLSKNGMYFWDYGNAFLLEASRAGADVLNDDGSFRYPSYVEDIMGPICFDYGFGPYRWVCTSGKPEDLSITDKIAEDVLTEMLEPCAR
jgi:urocanate hydratase